MIKLVRRFSYVFMCMYIILFLFVGMANYKLDNFPSQRPFFYLHILLCLVHCALFIVLAVSHVRFKIRMVDLYTSFLFLFFFAFMYVHAVSDSYQSEVVISLIHYLGTFSLLKFCLFYFSPLALKGIILYALVIFAVAASLVGIFLLLNVGLQYDVLGLTLTQNLWTYPRIHGFMGEPTSLGGLIGLVLIIIFFNKEFKLRKLFICVLVICLILSGSRNSLISLAAAAIFSSIFISNYFHYNHFSKFVIFIALPFLGAIFFLEMDFFESLFDRGASHHDENGRLFIWSNVLGMIGQFGILDFVVGRGVGALKEEYRSAFNTFLEIFHDVGIFGVFNIIFLFFLLFLKIRASKEAELFCLFFYLIVFNQFIHWVFRDTFSFVSFGFVYLYVFSGISVRNSDKFEHLR